MQHAISILIPVYNYAIATLVEELHRQALKTGATFEICVFDDASTRFVKENSAIEQLEFVHFKRLDENIGRTAIRNMLAQHATHNWLLFLDADVNIPSEIFISQYLQAIKHDVDVIFGGVSYSEKTPSKDHSLRWEYGKAREAKLVSEREQSPYFIISQNLLIQKQTFLKANVVSENYYGLDNLFSNQLQRMQAHVLHINNPVIHLGLEDNKSFMSKALKAVETTVIFEERGLMDPNLRPIQKAYQKLKNFGATGIFSFFVGKMKQTMEKNFQSGSPNLFWFDLYRLHYYIQLKKKPRA